MFKCQEKKEDCQSTTTQSLFPQSESLGIPCTLTTLIDQVPRQTRIDKTNKNLLSNCSSRKWSQTETRTFHKLLRHYGLDFTLMSYHQCFKGSRSPKELSSKYKKQYRVRPEAIEAILNQIQAGGLFGRDINL